MTAKDQQKVMNKGFRIIRSDLFRMAIKVKTKQNPNWVTLEKGFDNKTQLERRMKELLKNESFIED